MQLLGRWNSNQGYETNLSNFCFIATVFVHRLFATKVFENFSIRANGSYNDAWFQLKFYSQFKERPEKTHETVFVTKKNLFVNFNIKNLCPNSIV